MSVKLLLLVILSFIMGFAFCAIGVYFLSQKFLNKLNEATPVKSAENFKHNGFKAKGSGYVAIALGALTILWATFFILFPQILSLLVLIYMIFLVIAFVFLSFVFR